MSGFSMRVVDAFEIKDRGVVVTGTVDGGHLDPGNMVYLDSLRTECRGIETFGGRKSVGDKIGVLLGDNISLDYAKSKIGALVITIDWPHSDERRFRIVINPKRPADRHGHYPWQCTLCGAEVAHVDRHAAWHERLEGIKYGDLLPGVPPEGVYS